MKRFWTDVTVEQTDDGWKLLLDGRPLRTPQRALLLLPNRTLAEAVADEWQAVEGEVKPADMRLTGLANAAVDHVAPDPESFAANLARYAESDLLCYRADYPEPLAERQQAEWEPLLCAVEQRFDVGLHRTVGINFVAQPPEALRRIRQAFASFSPYQLAALSPMVTILGSAVAVLALVEGMESESRIFDAGMLDEDWQAEQWGHDELAAASRADRRAQFDAAVTFWRLLAAGD